MKFVASVPVAFAGLVFMSSCSPEKTDVPEIVRPVVTMDVPAARSSRERSFSGTAQAAVETPLSFRVSGEIVNVAVKAGNRVEKGELIAEIDSTDYELQVKQAEAEVAQAKAHLVESQSQYERMRQLYEVETVSAGELDSQRAVYKSARAQHEAALKALEMARRQRDYCKLQSPMEGVVAKVPVEAHQTVAAGETVATLASGQHLEVKIGVPEALIGSLEQGQKATVKFESLPRRSFAAKVVEMGVQSSISSTYPVILQIQEKSSELRLGMVCDAVLTFNQPHSIVVPPQAVASAADGTRYVWIFNTEAARVERRTVEVGDLLGNGLQILNGIETGEILVTRGVHRLNDGMKVRLLEDQI